MKQVILGLLLVCGGSYSVAQAEQARCPSMIEVTAQTQPQELRQKICYLLQAPQTHKEKSCSRLSLRYPLQQAQAFNLNLSEVLNQPCNTKDPRSAGLYPILVAATTFRVSSTDADNIIALVEYGAQLDVKDPSQNTPLMRMSSQLHTLDYASSPVEKIFCKAIELVGKDPLMVDAQNNRGETAVHILLNRIDLEDLRSLVRASHWIRLFRQTLNPNLSIENDQGQTVGQILQTYLAHYKNTYIDHLEDIQYNLDKMKTPQGQSHEAVLPDQKWEELK